MEEIRAVPWNGRTVASLFAGCGGSSLGYRMEGFRILAAHDFDEHAVETYRANASPATIVEKADITELDPGEMLFELGIEKRALDVLDGSPPCQTFSASNSHQSAASKLADSRTDLFQEFIRILRGLEPRVFVAENVEGLVRGTAKGVFKRILSDLRASGYRVEARVVDAQWLGVPQRRTRVIFVGVREDLGIDPRHPTPLPYRYSVKDALPYLLDVKEDTRGQFSRPMSTDEPVPTLTSHSGNQMFARGLEGTAVARELEKMRPGQQSEKYYNLVRAHPGKPSPCITASAANATASVTHPYEMRKFTVDEAKALCSFPADFRIEGSTSKAFARLGNSVPPLMMRAVAREVRYILEEVEK